VHGGVVKDLTARFAEVERRILAVVEENGRLRGRVRELERELASVRDSAQELERHRERQTEVRERLERILKTLDAITANADDRAPGVGQAKEL
jgi:chromosome segregation ATPase